MPRSRSWRRAVAAALAAAAFGDGAAAQDLNPTAAEIEAFLRADYNEDQILTPAEFRIFVDAMAESGQTTAQTIRFFGAYGFAFMTVDANEDGRLEPAELRAADDAYRSGE